MKNPDLHVGPVAQTLQSASRIIRSIATTADTIRRYPVISTTVIDGQGARPGWKVKDQIFTDFPTARRYSIARFVIDNDLNGELLQ